MGGGGVGVGGQSTTITQQPHQQQSLHFELQGQVQQTPAMEEFLEHIFAMPWDYNAGAGAMAMERVGADFAMVGVGANNNGDNNNIDSGGSSMSTAAQKRFTMSLTPPGLLNNGTLVGGNQASALVSSQALVNQVLEEKKESGVESVHCSADDALITTHLHQQQQQLQGEETQSPRILCLCLLFLRRSVSFVRQDAGELATERRRESRFAADVQDFLEGWSCLIYLGWVASLTRSTSVGSSGSEDSGGQLGRGDHCPPPAAPTWCQPYAGMVPHLPMNPAQTKAEHVLCHGEFSSQDALSLGKRFREDDEDSLCENHSGITGNGPTSAPSGFGGSPQQGLPSVGGRPRVQARRGQATDPHSIAERTDKASMLDEIIDYVKFLQLQVKILSMSRLGGAGAVAPTTSDLPAEGSNNMSATISHSSGTPSPVQDGIALTERQVTQLLEDDMGSAMQYLQSKGLCLMPIALATAISTTNNSRGAQGGVGDRQRTSAAGSNGGLITDGLVNSEQASKDNSREVESINGTTSMGTHNGPECEGKLTDGP
ncbi:hypothetical protein BDL97_09G035000 [Sphagnum fallax]|nr:hypothetical protein BDL97_09G035000 [Sphagnum fallax]